MLMGWILYSVMGAMLSSLWTLSVKRGVDTIVPTDFSSAYTVICLLLVIMVNRVLQVPFSLNKYGLLAGLCQGVSAIILTHSFTTTPNPGLTMGTFRSQSILTAVLAYLVLGSSLTSDKVVAMLVVSLGVLIIGHSESRPPERFQAKIIKETPKKTTSTTWFVLAILAGVVMSGKDLITKVALNQPGSNNYVLLFNVLLANAVIIVIYDRITTGTFKIHDHDSDQVVTWRDYLIIIWTAVVSAGYAFTMIGATREAPNVGYAKSVDTLGVIITTILSRLIFQSDLRAQSLVGVALVSIGILYISFS